MGTSNFARGNASRVFAVLMNEDRESKAPKDVRYSDEDGSDNDRNYCATELFSYRASKWYGDL